MTEFKIAIKEGATPAENSLEVMYEGDADQIAKILAHAMSVDPDVKNVILKALPMYLFKANIDPQTFCDTLMPKKNVSVKPKIIPHELVYPTVNGIKMCLNIQERLQVMSEEEMVNYLGQAREELPWLGELIDSKNIDEILANQQVKELITNTKADAVLQIKQFTQILEILEKD